MALELFVGEGGDFLDVPFLALQHRESGLCLVADARTPLGIDAGRKLTLAYDGEQSAEQLVVEVLRLAEVGRQALIYSARHPSHRAHQVVRRARVADERLRLVMGLPLRPAQPPGPPELAEIEA